MTFHGVKFNKLSLAFALKRRSKIDECIGVDRQFLVTEEIALEIYQGNNQLSRITISEKKIIFFVKNE